MIVTLTPNPSLDLLFRADRLVWDDANRLASPRRRPGGQGINVVRALRTLEPRHPALALAPLGGPTGRELQETLQREGTPLRAVPIGRETRVFVGVRESSTGRSLLLNPRGPEVTPDEGEAILSAVAEALDGSPTPSWLVASGSLLPGLPSDFYARVGRLARDRRVRFLPDCDGEALSAAAPVADLLVPNEAEAGRLVGRTITAPEEAVMAGRALLSDGPERVVITLGRQGAVSVSHSAAWWACPRPEGRLSRDLGNGTAVGAGDVLLAALLLAEAHGADAPTALARAVAAGTAVLLGRGSRLVRREDVERVFPHVVVQPQDP